MAMEPAVKMEAGTETMVETEAEQETDPGQKIIQVKRTRLIPVKMMQIKQAKRIPVKVIQIKQMQIRQVVQIKRPQEAQKK